MNKWIFAAAIAACAVAPVVGQDSKPAESAETGKPVAPAVDCETRQFETKVEFEKDGQKRQTKLKLCPIKGEAPENWAKTLKDAKAKIAAHPDITAESKARFASEIDAEIQRAQLAGVAGQSIESANIELPANPIPPAERAPEYGSYPKLPPAPVAGRPTTTTPVATTQNLKSLPPAKPVAKPRLMVRCLESGERGEGANCTSLARTTRLAIQADEQLGNNVSLRFLRKGEIRGEIALAGMRQGQLLRSPLPPQLCAGVASSRVEIQVLNANQVAETLGPYKLRC